MYALVEKKLVLGGNVRQVLQFVESGSAPLGIVFATDAGSVTPGSPVVRLFDFPESTLDSPILYPIAVVSASKRKAESARFVAFLLEKSSRDAFVKYGFGLK
jgi:molybdate transport system substrate-binding protein